MIIKELKYKRINLQFKYPFNSSKQTLTERNVLILEAVTENGFSVFGEAAPLPGFSKESFNDLLAEVELITYKFRTGDLAEQQSFILGIQCPSLKFALEQIFVSVNNVNERKELTVKFNLLFSLGKFQTIDLTSVKNSVIKLKLGIEPFEKEVDILKRLTESIKRNNIRLRIDVNANWSFEQTLKFAGNVNLGIIEYIEQPVEKTTDLVRLADESSLPVAADESLYDERNLEAVMNSGIKYLIVKPMVFGGLAEIEKRISSLSRDKEIIISSALESSLGWSHLAYIASKISPDKTHGVSTFDLFVNNPYNIEYTVSENNVSLLFPQNVRGI